jgi:hypothetical protein
MHEPSIFSIFAILGFGMDKHPEAKNAINTIAAVFTFYSQEDCFLLLFHVPNARQFERDYF